MKYTEQQRQRILDQLRRTHANLERTAEDMRRRIERMEEQTDDDEFSLELLQHLTDCTVNMAHWLRIEDTTRQILLGPILP